MVTTANLEGRLLDQRGELSHTRGVSLLNLCRLCVFLFQQKSHRLTFDEIGKTAKKNGLNEFKDFTKKSVTPTRTRHCWYALERLRLVEKVGTKEKPSFELLENGQRVAEIVNAEGIPLGEKEDPFKRADPVVDVSENLRVELIRVVVDSAYVREIWLSFFMDRDKFDHQQLVMESQPFLIEKVTPPYRFDLTKYGSKRIDSGYRFYPHYQSVFERLTIAGNQGGKISASMTDGLILSDTARKEIHDGLRSWTYRELGLTNETPLEISAAEAEKVEGKRKEWIVKKRMPDDDRSMIQVAELVREIIRTTGNGRRIRVPNLIVELCHSQSISLPNAKQLLRRLRELNSSHFYFEGASENVIMDKFTSVPNPDDYFLNIGGIWRPTILLVD